jgi:RND superfamily putative drug exporter
LVDVSQVIRRPRAGRLGQVKNPRSVVVAAFLIIVAWFGIGGVGGQLVGKLSQVQKNDSSEFLPASAESRQVQQLAKGFTGEQALPLIVVAEGRSGGQLTPADLATVGSFAKAVPGLAVDSGGTVADYLAAPQVPVVSSKDGKAAMVLLPLDQAKVNAASASGERALGPVAAAVKKAAAAELSSAALSAHVTGPAGFIADVVEAFAGIDGLLLLVTLAVVLLILLVVYRSPVLPFAVLLSAVFGLSLAGLVVHPLAKNGHIDLSGQSQGIMFILVVGAATDYALLLVARYKEELHRHEQPWDAMKVAWRAAVEPIVASGTTVILGLLCLLLADLGSTRGLGPVGALGIVGAMLSSLTLLPALLVLGRRWIFWPSIPHPDHKGAEARLDEIGQDDATARGWARLARGIGRAPRRTWVVTTLVLLAMAAFVPTFKAEGIQQSETFLVSVESVTGQQVLERHFDAGAGSPLTVIALAVDAEAALGVLSKEAGLDGAQVGVAPGAPPKTVDGRVLLQATLRQAPDSIAAGHVVERVRADLDSVSPRALVGGRAAEALDVREASSRDLKVVVPTITILVFLVLALLLRALVGPLMLMAANLLSFAATIGFSALVFNHLFRFAGVDPATTTIGFVFLVALGVDYSIFLMTRAREETARRGTRKGMLAALTVTGGVITSAGIVLAATFGALAVIPLLFLAQIAFIVAFGVLLDALVVRSLLVPAAVIDLGDRTWWPSRLARGRADNG